jgi:hypothetical protein
MSEAKGNPPQMLSPQAFDVEFEEKRRVLYDMLKLFSRLSIYLSDHYFRIHVLLLLVLISWLRYS